MNGKVDKALKRERNQDPKAKTDWKKILREQEDEMSRVKSFKEKYPTYALWERAVDKRISVDDAVRELTEFGDFPKKPRAVRNWLEKEMYEKEVSPLQAQQLIKERLYW